MEVLSSTVNNKYFLTLEKSMQVNISITLTQDDIDAGLTADAAVKKAFPNGSTEVPYVDSSLVADPDDVIEQDAVARAAAETAVSEAEIEASGSEAEEDSIHAPEPEGDQRALTLSEQCPVDSAGVPWNAEIHSSNKKKYGTSSKEAGRWIWKKNTDVAAREELARQLAAAVAPAEPAVAVNSESSVVTPPAAVPAPENAAPPAPPAPENAAPPAPPAAENAEGGLNWPEFLQCLKQSGKTAGDVTPLLAPAGVETIAQLADNGAARNNIAAQLGLIA